MNKGFSWYRNFYLNKYDDEWYIVTIKDRRIREYDKYRYYKCDTFDGFKQLFNNY